MEKNKVVEKCERVRCKSSLRENDRFCGSCRKPNPNISEEYRAEVIDCKQLHMDLYADAWHHLEGFSFKGHVNKPYCPMCGKRIFTPIIRDGEIVGQSASL